MFGVSDGESRQVQGMGSCSLAYRRYMGLFNRTSQHNNGEIQDETPLLVKPPATDDQGCRSMGDHCDYLLSQVEPLAPFGVSLAEAWGLTLCEDIKGDGNVPPVPVAETNGYAFCSSDIAATAPGARPVLKVVKAPEAPVQPPATPSGQPGGGVAAGAIAAVRAFGIGEALPVRAGQALPVGADTVVTDREVSHDEDAHAVKLLVKTAKGDWVRDAGAEVSEGGTIMTAGTVLDDRSSALLAAAGFSRVLVRPRARIALADVVDSGAAKSADDGRGPGVGMYLANGAAKADGATIYHFEVDLAEPQASRERLNDELIRADLVLTVGGMTDDGADPRLVGLLNSLGAVDVAEVSMLPGRRHGFGLIGDERTPLVMLPEDAGALLAAYHAFARPVLRKLMGAEPYSHEAVLCFADRDFDAELDVPQLVPCQLRQDRDRYLAGEVISRRHSQLPALVAADALVLLPGDKARVYTGEALAAWLLNDQRIV